MTKHFLHLALLFSALSFQNSNTIPILSWLFFAQSNLKISVQKQIAYFKTTENFSLSDEKSKGKAEHLFYDIYSAEVGQKRRLDDKTEKLIEAIDTKDNFNKTTIQDERNLAQQIQNECGEIGNQNCEKLLAQMEKTLQANLQDQMERFKQEQILLKKIAKRKDATSQLHAQANYIEKRIREYDEEKVRQEKEIAQEAIENEKIQSE